MESRKTHATIVTNSLASPGRYQPVEKVDSASKRSFRSISSLPKIANAPHWLRFCASTSLEMSRLFTRSTFSTGS